MSLRNLTPEELAAYEADESWNGIHRRRPTPVSKLGAWKLAINMTPRHISSVLDLLAPPGGGFTLHPDLTAYSPDLRYVVAVKGFTYTVDSSKLRPEDFTRYFDANQRIAKRDGLFIGGWHDEQDGLIYFDVSELVASREEALALGKERGEKAIYDSLKGEEIRVEHDEEEPVTSEWVLEASRRFAELTEGGLHPAPAYDGPRRFRSTPNLGPELTAE